MGRKAKEAPRIGRIHSFRGTYFRKEPVRVEKVDRNAPCPCGSGKKYKKCCAERRGFFARLWHAWFRKPAAREERE